MRTHAYMAQTCHQRYAKVCNSNFAKSIIGADVYHIILCAHVQHIFWKTCAHVSQKSIWSHWVFDWRIWRLNCTPSIPNYNIMYFQSAIPKYNRKWNHRSTYIGKALGLANRCHGNCCFSRGNLPLTNQIQKFQKLTEPNNYIPQCTRHNYIPQCT